MKLRGDPEKKPKDYSMPCEKPSNESVYDVQGRPVNVKHDARCVMGKVGGKTKNPKRGEI